MMDESILSCHHSCHCSSYHGSGDHHHMIINDYHCSDDHHHHMIKDIRHCNFALELFSIVVSRKSRTDCSQMFFQLRARRSVSAGSQIPITIITFYALWPTILFSIVSLKNIYPIFQKMDGKMSLCVGEVHWISEGCFTQTIYFSIDGPGQIYSKLVAVKVGLEILKIQTKLKFKKI